MWGAEEVRVGEGEEGDVGDDEEEAEEGDHVGGEAEREELHACVPLD